MRIEGIPENSIPFLLPAVRLETDNRKYIVAIFLKQQT